MSVFDDWEEAKDWPKVEPVSYRFTDEYWGEIFITCTHFEKHTWAIYQGDGGRSPCIRKSAKMFVYESFPSYRTEADLDDTRFPSVDSALEFYHNNKEAIQSMHHRHPKFKENK